MMIKETLSLDMAYAMLQLELEGSTFKPWNVEYMYMLLNIHSTNFSLIQVFREPQADICS